MSKIKPEKSVKYDRHKLNEKAIVILSQKKYEFFNEISGGTFADILSFLDKNNQEMIAAKIMDPLKTSLGEVTLWPTFDHPNVLPVLDIIHDEKVDIFLMPYHPKCLKDIRDKDKFCHCSKAFEVFLQWMKDVLNGLDYLHKVGVCHLDLKGDNILITYESNAIICDFGSMDSVKEPTSRYALPLYYRPPEAWPIPKCTEPMVDGKAFDVWSVGMILFQGFTNCWMEQRLWGQTNWEKEIYPMMFECLQELPLYNLMQSAFPSAVITNTISSQALNLLRGVFRYNSEDRPTPVRILQHILIAKCSSNDDMLEPDPIWNDISILKSRDEDLDHLTDPENLDSHQDENLEQSIRKEVHKLIDRALHHKTKKPFSIEQQHEKEDEGT